MITTTYKCDRCGHEQKTPEQMWKIGVWFDSLDSGRDWKYPQRQELWCRGCLESFGMLPKVNDRLTTVTVPPPSFEELLRNFIRETVTEQE